MRIPNLIMQGLIAGAVLLIPTDVFAEKESAEKRNPAAEQKGQSDLKEETAAEKMPDQAKPKENVQNPAATNTRVKKNSGNGSTSKGSEKGVEGRQSKSLSNKAILSQKAKKSDVEQKNVPQRHNNKNVPNRKPENSKADTSRLIHTAKPLEPKIHQDRVVNENKKKPVTSHVILKEDKQPDVRVVPIPLELPLEKIPEQPASKVMPVTAGQSSSHSSSAKDSGNGAAAIAYIKASLALPLIFIDGKKVSVYFSRLDLLRSQWVNAPPAPPPESAL